ncbi:MAG: hypothetical protein DWQ37_06710 [Planctomycetota bacterium]|nr:MAG: hypothetical protein DWQ37_06710 [Planctomycetota bacterium]
MRYLAQRFFRHVVLGCSLVMCLAWLAAAREWSDITGTFKSEAELLRYDGKVARLRYPTGLEIDIPIDKLGKADVEYLKKTYPDGMKPKATKDAPADKEPEKKPEPREEPVAAATASPAPETATASRPAASAEMKVEVVGLGIHKEIKRASSPGGATMFGGFPGTQISLMIGDGARTIIGLDEEQSKITFCRDDKGTDLQKGSSGGPAGFGELRFQTSDPSQAAVVEIIEPSIPTANATRIGISGELHLICGEGEATQDLPEVALAQGTKIDGPVPIVIQQVQPQQFGDMKMMIALQSSSPMSTIKKLAFLDAAGNEIPMESMSSGSFGSGNNMTYTRMLGLGEVVDKAAVRIVSYETTETVKVPLKMVFSIGL